jgi:trk system potassium uptake protein TrkA
MKIVLVGCGKVGTALARQLSEEGHNITVIDTNKVRVEHVVQTYDVLGLVGNGASISTLSEAGIEEADVFIAVTESDELNLLCCMFAKKAGHCHAIARVRNPSYSHELDFIKQQIGISAIINPEMAAAKEISRLLRFPGASKIDTFAGGRVRLIKFELTEAQGLDGMSIRDIPGRLKCDVLICAVERGSEVIIPDGNFMLHNGDVVTFIATQEKAHDFFSKIALPVRPVHNAMIVGGGAIAYYLGQELLENNIRVRIVERDPERCVTLTEAMPKAQILCGDGSNREFLLSEGLPAAEAFVALTNFDEENVLLTLFAKKHSKGKLVTKVNRLEFDDILGSLDLGSTIYPKYMTCDYIVQYVRALQNEAGSNIKTLYRILDDRVEALEFTVHEQSEATGIPLSQLPLKSNQLICCITRGDRIIIPRGGDQIQVGDTVIVVTLEHGLHDVRDIVRV